MPLIIDDNIIHSINGPRSLYLLEQTNLEQGLNDNFFIFFGDEHTMDDFKPCFNEPNCTELQTDFIKMLNTFASTTRCDFYIESFLENQILEPKNKIHYNKNLAEQQKIYYNLRNDPQLRLLNENDSKQIIDEYEKLIKKNRYGPKNQRSNMVELNYLYNSCFYHENMKDSLCPYKNINWQFADARKYQEKEQQQNYKIEKFFISHFNEFNEQFKEYFTGDEKNINKNSLLTFYNEWVSQNVVGSSFEFENDMILLLENLNGFIRKLLERPLFQKQLAKMNDTTKQIITVESFFGLGEYYKNHFFSDLILTDFIVLFKLLIEFLTLCDKNKFYEYEINNYEEKKAEYDNIIDKLNQLQFTEEHFQQCLYYLQCMNNLAIDIYFILRSYKQDKGEPNKKVVLSYLGSIHSDAYVHYFTEIIKTHRVIFASQNNTGELRRIEITPDIDLNEIMRHTPILTNFISGMKVKLYKNKDGLSLCSGAICAFVVMKLTGLGGKKNKTKKIKRKTIKRR